MTTKEYAEKQKKEKRPVIQITYKNADGPYLQRKYYQVVDCQTISTFIERTLARESSALYEAATMGHEVVLNFYQE